jgi:hypothetical protein
MSAATICKNLEAGANVDDIMENRLKAVIEICGPQPRQPSAGE